MSVSRRPQPFGAFLPAASSRATLPQYRVRRCNDACEAGLDGLDRFLLSCAEHELFVQELFERVPCSRTAASERVQRLIDLGCLTVRREHSLAAPRANDEDEQERETMRPSPVRNAAGRLGRESQSD